MESSRDPLGTFIPRPNEYERLVAYLLDQRFFLPVAISTSLSGGRGFGKTTLARAVCQDPRIQKSFSEGIIWVTLGHGLAPLELISRIEQIIYQLSGKRSALKDISEAEAQLHELLHPRRSLLVIDEADDESALQPFMQSGPGGACLLISHDDNRLPVSARRVFVDIMMPEESVALLVAGFPSESADSGLNGASLEAENETDESQSGSQTGDYDFPGDDRELIDSVDGLPTVVDDQTDIVGADTIRGQGSQLIAPLNIGPFSLEVAEMLEALADRLNEWPLLLALANGIMRGGLEQGDPDCATLAGALRKTHAALDRQEIQAGWRIDDPLQRKRVLDAMLVACLEPLDQKVREGYLDLAVFSEEESLPLAAAAVLWGLDDQQALAQVEQLARRALIDYNPVQNTLRLHSALHGCLRDQLWVGQFAKLNNRLVEAYQARCPDGWPSGPDDGYFFQHLIGHLNAAGRHDETQTLLFDFAWLAAFLHCSNTPGGRRGDLYALLSDFEMALSTSLDRQSAELRLVQEALRLSAPAIARDPRQLAPQLLGRLLSFAEPEIQALVQKARGWHQETWLRPLAACFNPPGSEEVRTLVGHMDWVTGVSIYPDGQHAVSSSLDGTLRVWDLANGQVLRIIEAHPDEVIFTDPKSSMGSKGTSPLGDPRAEVDLDSLERPRGTGSLPANALGGARATGALGGARVTGSLGGTLGTGMLNAPPTALNPGGASSVAVTPDGQRAVTAGWDGAIRIWNLSTGQTEREIAGHIEPIGALILTPDGKHIITGADDRLVRVWDLESGQMVMELVGHTDLVRALAITPDGRTLISGSWDNTIRVWDLDNGQPLHVLIGHEGWVRSVAVTPDGYHVISGAWDRTLRIWDLWTGEMERMLTDFRAPVFAISVTPDNRLLITGGGDGSVGLWNFETGEELRLLAGHTGGVNALTITAGGRFAISASDDRTLRIWDLVAVQGSMTRPGHEGPVHALAGLPGGRQLVSASWDGTIKVWEPAAGRELRVMEGHGGGVIALAVTADGQTALTGLRDKTLKLWDLTNGNELRVLAGHESPVTAVAITPDGKTAASGDDLGVLKVWDLSTGACLAEFHGEGAIWACAITPDGRTVTASEASGKLYFLEIET